jgi:hypothetical protein
MKAQGSRPAAEARALTHKVGHLVLHNFAVGIAELLQLLHMRLKLLDLLLQAA